MASSSGVALGTPYSNKKNLTEFNSVSSPAYLRVDTGGRHHSSTKCCKIKLRQDVLSVRRVRGQEPGKLFRVTVLTVQPSPVTRCPCSEQTLCYYHSPAEAPRCPVHINPAGRRFPSTPFYRFMNSDQCLWPCLLAPMAVSSGILEAEVT